MANDTKWPKMIACSVGRLHKRTNHIHCLSDELLMEVLRRLPNCKSVTQCKFVCKRWAALASDPWFIAQFVDFKFKHAAPFAIIMWYDCPLRFRDLFEGSEIFLRPLMFDAQNSSFSPFISPGDDDASAMLVASCNDFVLNCRYEADKKKFAYCIGNVQTRQFVQLPSPPFYYCRHLSYGLICDPFYSYGGEIVVNAAYRYSVAVIHCVPKHLSKVNVHVFSSTNHTDGRWYLRVLSLPKKCYLVPCSGFSFDGKLHFTCYEGIFSFDQNSIECVDEIRCHIVEWPLLIAVPFLVYSVGHSKGNLMVSLLERAVLRVWVLEDYKTSNWVLHHRVEIGEWVSRESWMTKEIENFSRHRPPRIRILGFHPSNSDVIYMVVPGYIFLCNLSTKTVELASHIPVAVSQSPGPKLYLWEFNRFLVSLPSWPTPLPRLSAGL